MNLFLKLLSAFAVTGILFFGSSCQSTRTGTGAKMLKFNPETGKGYDYEVSMDLTQNIMGQDMKMNSLMYYSMEVEKEEKDFKHIISTFSRLKIKTSIAGINIDVDTDIKPSEDSSDYGQMASNLMNKIFRGMVGQKFSMKVNQEGQILEITGFDKIGENIASNLGLEGEEKEQFIELTKTRFNSEETRDNLQRFWYFFPNKEIKPGDSWEKTYESGGQMPAVYHSVFKVKEIEGNMVYLDEESKVKPRQDSPAKISGDVKGTSVVDSRTGLVVSSNQQVNFVVSAEGRDITVNGKISLKGKAR
ncbi:MAG: DUF6263 family protein [Chitinophagaceae bacterium]|nr:DUF6263 family protein [Chitinophagaceae bacterium]